MLSPKSQNILLNKTSQKSSIKPEKSNKLTYFVSCSKQLPKDTANFDKENMPHRFHEPKILPRKPDLPEKVFFEDFNETASEMVDFTEENSPANDLICDEKIQDIRWKGRFEVPSKEKKEMPNITEETDEDMSNNCSPNKTEILNAFFNQKRSHCKLS